MKKYLIGIIIGISLTVITYKTLSTLTHFATTSQSQIDKSAVYFKENALHLYDGTYAFDSGEGDISGIYTDYQYDKDGDFSSASTVIPTGAVLTTVREYYTNGFYEGKIKITHSDGTIENLEKVFFSINRDGRPIDYFYPNTAKKYKYFPGKIIKGRIHFR